MILSIILLVGIIGGFYVLKNAQKTQANWYNVAWTNRMPLTIDHTKVSTASSTILSNFPVLVNITSAYLKTVSNGGFVASTTGADILFTSSDGATKIPYERESFASTTGALIAWVKIPTLATSTDTTFYIYYGNSTVGLADQQQATSVWDVNYKAVYHLKETGTGSVGDYKDSTSNGNNSTNTTNQPAVVTGKIGNAQSVTLGTTQGITLPSIMNFNNGQAWTIEGWMNQANLETDNTLLAFGTTSTDGYLHFVCRNGTAYLGFYGDDLGDPSPECNTTGVWNQMAATYNGLLSRSLYFNGNLASSANSAGQLNVPTSSPVQIAATALFGNTNSETLDEIRISNIVRSADWISTGYKNQNSPSTFLSLGAQQNQTGSWYNSAWQYRKLIIIDHTKVSTASSTNLSNFPMLYSVTDLNLRNSALGGGVASSSGADILFSAADGVTKLNYERETYSSTTGQLIAWVQIPVLSATADTVIYMYYGNATNGLADQQSASAAWDSNYKGVYHANGSGPSTSDSTNNASNASISGTVTAASGQVGGGASFISSGTSNYDIPSAKASAAVFNAGTIWTASSWINIAASSPGMSIINGNGQASQPGLLYGYGGNGLQLFDSRNGIVWSTSSLLSTGWHYVVWTYNSTDHKNHIYVDGSSTDISNTTYTWITSASFDLFWGLNPNTGGGVTSWNGPMDELRVSNMVRSADWIQTEYQNQYNPAAFYVTSQQQTLSTKHEGLSSRAGWYNTAWPYRMAITINHSLVSTASSTTLSNFPFLASTTSASLKSISNGGLVASSTGADIVFTASDGSTKIPYERESYSPTTGAILAWVKVPSLSPFTDTTIYMYYGNAATGLADQQQAASVWDSTFAGVWHFPNGSTLTTTDSTNNANNPTVVSTGPTATTGLADGGANFGGGGGLNISSVSNSLKPSTAVTVEAWINPNSTSQGSTSYSHAVSLNNVIPRGNPYYDYTIFVSNASFSNTYGLGYGSGGSAATLSSGVGISVGTWAHVVGVFTASNVQVYVNGVLKVSSGSGATLTYTGSSSLTFGYNGDMASNGGETTNSKIDEVRVSNVARSADWIATEYNNQSSPGTFETWGNIQGIQGVTSNSGNWYISPGNGTWSNRVAITIDHTKVNTSTGTTTPLTNFPVLISATYANWKSIANGGYVASSTGADILFTSSDGSTKLNYERELYASTTGQLIAWVQIPSLSSVTDTTIYMYFGNPNSSLADQQSSATWDSNYKGVWHLPNGTTLTTNDSTSNALNGTATNMSAGIGQIDGAGSFNGINTVGGGSKISTASVATGATNSATLSAWVKTANNAQDGQGILYNGSDNNANGFGMFINQESVTSGHLYFLYGGIAWWDTGTIVTSNVWHYVTMSLSSNGQSATAYLDGVSLGSHSFGAAPNTPASYTEIGRNDWIVGHSSVDRYFNGLIDEARVSNTIRSADWIATEYNNQSSPSTFVTFGTQQGNNGVAAWNNTGWSSRKLLVIDHSKVAAGSDLINFPVLINLTDPDWAYISNGGKVGYSTGADIYFTAADGTTILPYEREFYNSSSGNLVAWVKVPTLSSVSDTDIYIYYGNSTAGLADQQNKTAVWSNNYVGVWHLPNGSSLTGNDSTSNGNNAGTITATAVAGQIDGAANVSSSHYVDITHSSSLNFSGPATIEAWVYPTSSASFQNIIGMAGSGYLDWGVLLSLSGTGYIDYYSNGNGINVPVNPGWNTNAWNFIVVVPSLAGFNTSYIYINGVLAGSGINYSLSTNSTDDVYIGYMNSATSYPLNGYVDEARLSNVVRSAGWIQTEYNNENSPSTFVYIGQKDVSTRASATPTLKARGHVKFR